MGLVIDSFKASLNIIRANPVILGATFVYALLAAVPDLLGPSKLASLSLVWKALLSFIIFFTVPFVLGGLLGMVAEATKRPTSLSTFVETGRKNYVSLYAANIFGIAILLGWMVGTMLILGLPTQIALFFLKNVAPLYNDIFVLLIAVLVIIGLLTSMTFFIMFFQFYGIGIVVHRYGAWETFRKSFGFTRPRLSSVFYYTILWVLVVLLAVIPGLAIDLYNTIQTGGELSGILEGPVSTSPSMLSTVINLLLRTVSTAVWLTFLGVFYLRYKEELPIKAP